MPVESVLEKERILTGMRPTGALHLGHYVGALENWIRYQQEYDSYFLIADYQALGDHSDDIPGIRRSVRDVTLDWLSVGLDPQESTFVIQSYVPEHAELFMLLSMITPLSLMQRNPTLKAEMSQLNPKDLSLGFFNYPASQVADILLPKAHLVPVGEDQLPHIELTRTVARKFNKQYKDIFPVPKAEVGRVPRLVGIDGQSKMSKSLGNCIYLSDNTEDVNKKVMRMFTDPTRLKATDPGHIEGNAVFIYLDAFHQDREELKDLQERYEQGGVGDVVVKRLLAKTLNDFLDPIRERRVYFEANPNKMRDAIMNGTERAQKVAKETMLEVREAMGITKYESWQS